MLANHLTKPTTQHIHAKRHSPRVVQLFTLSLEHVTLSRIGSLLDRNSSRIGSLLRSNLSWIRSPLGPDPLSDRIALSDRIYFQIGSYCRDSPIQISYLVQLPGQPFFRTFSTPFINPLLQIDHSQWKRRHDICHFLLLCNKLLHLNMWNGLKTTNTPLAKS